MLLQSLPISRKMLPSAAKHLEQILVKNETLFDAQCAEPLCVMGTKPIFDVRPILLGRNGMGLGGHM